MENPLQAKLEKSKSKRKESKTMTSNAKPSQTTKKKMELHKDL
jgi:hypothetical protein